MEPAGDVAEGVWNVELPFGSGAAPAAGGRKICCDICRHMPVGPHALPEGPLDEVSEIALFLWEYF